MNINKSKARCLAHNIFNSELLFMLDQAQTYIVDWQQKSIVNPGCTKGVAWNILAADFELNEHYHYQAKVNMLREFGYWLPYSILANYQACLGYKSIIKANKQPMHQEPKLDRFKAQVINFKLNKK